MLRKEDVVERASQNLFGKPLVTNVYRSVVVEGIVAEALPDWDWCSADYFEYDFVHPSGTRLEVKQTALKQTWATTAKPRPKWDIAARKTLWVDEKRIAAPGRNADIYLLGLHAVVDATADHREPSQWQFFVVPAQTLPPSATIGIGPLRRLAEPVTAHDLAEAVSVAMRESVG